MKEKRYNTFNSECGDCSKQGWQWQNTFVLRVVLVSLLGTLLASCASQKWITAEVQRSFTTVRTEWAGTMKEESDAWHQSHDRLMKIVESNKSSIIKSKKRIQSLGDESVKANKETIHTFQKFDSGLEKIKNQVQIHLSEADIANTKKTSKEAGKISERVFPVWWKRCRAIDKRIETLSKRRKEKASWSKLALLPMQREVVNPLPPSVNNLFALSVEELENQDSSDQSVEDLFLSRAIRNYKASLASLESDVKPELSDWKPVWNGEKIILRSPAKGIITAEQTKYNIMLTGLVNKAYACDIMIQKTGSLSGYDLPEIGYYLNELMWCSQNLGSPYDSILNPLIRKYTNCLDNRSLMIEAPINNE